MNILRIELDSDILERFRTNVQSKIHNGIKSTSEQNQGLVEEAVLAAERIASPKGMYHVLPVLSTDKDAIQTSAGKIQSAMFSRLVNQCKGDRYIMFMVATIGEELEEIGRPNKGIFNQWVFDLAASELVEVVADHLEHHWEKKTDRAGMQCSTRFSPGYCDWSLEGQQIIFDALDVEKIGVKLSSHMIMTPEKSISAIKIAADKVPFSKPCFLCDREDCPWRKDR